MNLCDSQPAICHSNKNNSDRVIDQFLIKAVLQFR